jgi:hypothetical protein
MMEAMGGGLPGGMIGLAAAYVAGAYFILTLDRQRANSPSKDDTQVGIKLVLFGLLIAGIMLAAGGLDRLLAYALGGFKGGSGAIKAALPSILVGAGVAAAVALALLPRTNLATYRQAERYALGLLGVFYGIQMIEDLNKVLTNLFTSAPWAEMTSKSVAGFVVATAIAFFAIFRLGAHSGWTPPARPQPSYMPPGQGGGGYPPQQQYQQPGYPPQGGGYPPQGGGYPPQGGGYPPQGGGYPPA